MELYKNEVQVEEDASIHVVVVGSTDFHTRLRFSLLASSWLPRPVGVCLWSVVNTLLLLVVILVLLDLYSFFFMISAPILMLTILRDAIIFPILILSVVLVTPFLICVHGDGFSAAYTKILQIITRQLDCIYMLKWALGAIQHPALGLEEEGGGAEAAGPCALLKATCRASFTLRFVRDVLLVDYPSWKWVFSYLGREIVPWHDTIDIVI